MARAVREALPAPFVHLTFDQLIDSGALPRGAGWAAVRARVFDGWHRAVAAMGAAGVDVVWDHIIETPEWHEALRAVLAGRDVFFVALHCDLAELARREAGRADRAAGDAARDAGVVHLGKRYDLELRGEDAAVVNAARVVEAWERRAGVSAFFG